MHPFLRGILAGLLVLLSACETGSTPDAGGGTTTDGGPSTDGGVIADPDGGPTTDGGSLQPPSDTGHTCGEDRDCLSGICTRLNDGSSVCTGECRTEEHCIAGWSCETTVSGRPAKMCSCTKKTETCNLVDDDCDGVVDNAPAVDAACAESRGTGSVCQQGTCSCVLTCNGQCVNPDSDPANCGQCGTTCDSCSSGFCGTVLASHLASPSALILHGSELYWANQGDGTLMSMPVTGGTPKTRVSGQSWPLFLTADAQHLYWTNSQPGTTPSATVMQADLDGANPITLHTDTDHPGYIQLAGGNVYWSNGRNLMSVPIGGGTVTTVADYAGESRPFPFVIGPVTAYFDHYQGIVQQPLAGGTVSSFATENSGIGKMLIQGSHLYWSGNDIKMSPLTGGPVTTIVTQSHGYRFVLDDQNVYWNNPVGNVLMASKSTGKPVLLWRGVQQSVVLDVAVDATHIYFTAAGCTIDAYSEYGCAGNNGKLWKVRLR